MTKTLLADPTRTFEGIPFNTTLTKEQALTVWLRLLQHTHGLDVIHGDDARPELMVHGMDDDETIFDGIDVTGDSLSGLIDGDWTEPQIWEGTYHAGQNDTTAVYGRLSGRESWSLLGFGTEAEAQTIGDDWRMEGFQSGAQGMQKEIVPQTMTISIAPGQGVAPGWSDEAAEPTPDGHHHCADCDEDVAPGESCPVCEKTFEELGAELDAATQPGIYSGLKDGGRTLAGNTPEPEKCEVCGRTMVWGECPAQCNPFDQEA